MNSERNLGPSVGISFLLVAICLIVVFVLQVAVSGFTELFVLNEGVFEGELWRFVTAMFLHGSVSHLLSNLFALMLFGVILESLIGTRRFLLVYLLSGVLANVFSVFFYPSSLGASGAIFGIIGCITVLRPTMMIWAFGVVVPMFIASIIYVLVDVFGLFIPDGIGHIAHLSGIVVGLLCGLFFIRSKVFRKDVGRREKRDKVVLNEEYMQAWEDRFIR